MSTIEQSNFKQGYSINRLIITTAWVVFSGLCFFYAVMAFDYFLSFGSYRIGLWEQVLSTLVSSEYATGSGSVHVEQNVSYTKGFIFLLPHTMLGAVALAIGPFQFMSAFRKRSPKLHRTFGKIYLLAVLFSMICGIIYLAITPMGNVFSGKPFSIGLTGLDLMVIFTAYLAYSEIRAKRVVSHQAWMAFNFSLIVATPMLRSFWVIFGWVLPQYNQTQVNLGIVTYLLPFCMLASMIWYSLKNTRHDVVAKQGAGR